MAYGHPSDPHVGCCSSSSSCSFAVERGDGHGKAAWCVEDEVWPLQEEVEVGRGPTGVRSSTQQEKSKSANSRVWPSVEERFFPRYNKVYPVGIATAGSSGGMARIHNRFRGSASLSDAVLNCCSFPYEVQEGIPGSHDEKTEFEGCHNEVHEEAAFKESCVLVVVRSTSARMAPSDWHEAQEHEHPS